MLGKGPALIVMILCLQSLEVSQGFAVKTLYHVYTSIEYRFATTDIKCVIRNTDTVKRNLPFRLELPNDAFIVKFSMATGGKTYIGEVKERTSGSHVSFDDGGLSNVQGSRDGNKFGVSLPVAGGGNATYNLVYQERLRRHEGVYEQRLHLKLDQIVEDVYVETYIWEDKDVTKVVVPVMRPLNRKDADYGNETNPLAVINRLSSNRVQVIFAPSSGQQGANGLSHLFLVQYDVVHNPDGDIVIRDGFFMHFFAPDTTPLPKDIIFVIDKSGSMDWDNKMEQMIEAMVEIMDDIPSRDNINIVPFDSSAYQWKSYLVPANAANLNQAKRYIRNLPATGGTNIRAGIITARHIFLQRSSTERVAMIFFLTDGQDRTPVDDFPSIPIYGLAFGDDADLDYIKELCAKNAGFSQKIYTDIDAANQVKNFYDKISTVSMKKITFKYDSSIVDLSSLTTTEFSLVMKGSEVVVIGKLKKNVKTFNAQVEIEGEAGKIVKVKEINETQMSKTFSEKVTGKSVPDSFKGNMEKVWALTTIQNLLQEDEKKATTKGGTEKLEQALYLSVKYGFVSPLTSIVIKDPERHQQIVESAVKNEEEKGGDRMSEFIKSRPSTTTVTTTTTTTMMPKCKPNTTIDEAVKSDLLTLINMSGIYEHCMNIKPGASKYLTTSMNSLGRFKGMPKLKPIQAKNNTHDGNQRTVEINSFNVHYRERIFCVHPAPTFVEKSSYLLVQCPKGPMMYLFTGSIYKLRSANAERLLILSSSKFATVYLGTTSSWQIMGDLEFQSEVNGSSELILRVSCFNLTVQRSVNRLGLTYDITVSLDDATSKVSGLVADVVNNKGVEPNICSPLQDEDSLLQKYKQKDKKFMSYFLEMQTTSLSTSAYISSHGSNTYYSTLIPTNRPCRPRNPVSSSVKKTPLSETDFSNGIELCLGLNEELFRSLRSIMNGFVVGGASNTTGKLKRRFRKINHAENETSRVSFVQSFMVSSNSKSLCISPESKLSGKKLYELVTTSDHESLYLLTGHNDQLDKVTAERLILSSSSGDIVTVLLGTSKTWRVSGNAQFGVNVIDSRRLMLTTSALNLTLTKHVSKWDVAYTVSVDLNGLFEHGGLLGDAIKSDGQVTFLDNELLDEANDQTCRILTDNHEMMEPYMGSPMKFSSYFMEIIQDVIKTLPSDMFEKKKS